MKFRRGATCAALALAAASASPAAAQSTDAFVLPPGMLRLSVEGTHASFESAYGPGGNRAPLAASLAGPLDPGRFAPLEPLAANLQAFFAGTAGNPVEPGGVTLGTLDLQGAASRTDTRLGLAFGLFPRVEIGGSIVIHRGDRTVQRLGLRGGTIGINPDPAGNAAILAEIGWGQLGISEFLPVADSPEGLELQSRATALTGQPLALPTDTAGLDLLQTLLARDYGVPALASGVDRFRRGDTEAYARVLLISTMGRAPVPPPGDGLHLRVTATGGARFPTGEPNDTLSLLAAPTESRISGYFGGAVADIFLGSRFWASGSVRYASYGSTDVLRRVAPADAPLSVISTPVTVAMTPGSTLELLIAPRYRLTEAISLGAQYSATSVGETTFEGAEIPVLQGGTLQRAGLGIRYSSLPAYWDRRAAFPADVSLEYARTLGGPEGAAAGGVVRIGVSFLPQLYGRMRSEE